MFKKILCLFFALPISLLFSGCAIEDDIPYPFIESAITVFEVEGQCNDMGMSGGSAIINNTSHSVLAYVDESVDLSRVRIKRLEVSNDASIEVVDKAACYNPGIFPTHSFKNVENPEATLVNFSDPVRFKLTTYQDYEWTVTVAHPTYAPEPEEQLPNSSFDNWSTKGSGTRTLYQPWGEGETAFWDTGNRGATTVGASNSTGVTEEGRTFANLQSKYIVVKFAAGNIFAGEYLATDGTNGVLSFGREFSSCPKKFKFDYKFATSPINRVSQWNNAYGEYINKDMFSQLKGQPDSCQIYIALLDDYVDDLDREANTYEGKVYPWLIRTSPKNLQLFKPNSPRVIAYGQLTQGNNVDDWTTEEIVLNYRRTDRKPKYIMVVASSSKYGDYFTGGDKTLLQLDNLELVY